MALPLTGHNELCTLVFCNQRSYDLPTAIPCLQFPFFQKIYRKISLMG